MHKEKVCGIYSIHCLVTGKRYIGSSKNVFRRWNTHRAALNKKVHHSIHLQRAWDKYEGKNFSFEIIERCSSNTLVDREQYYLDLYKSYDGRSGFNMSPTAQGNKGVVWTQEARKKQSERVLGTKYSDERKKRISERQAGEKSHFAKLTNTDVLKIVEHIKNGRTYKDISAILDVHISTISMIALGKTWVSITGGRVANVISRGSRTPIKHGKYCKNNKERMFSGCGKVVGSSTKSIE